MKIVKLSKLNTQWLSTVDQGKRLELIAADKNGQEMKDVCYPLATILADENNETLLIEIYTEEGIVQIPLSELQPVMSMATGEVHSERWYEENIFNQKKTT